MWCSLCLGTLGPHPPFSVNSYHQNKQRLESKPHQGTLLGSFWVIPRIPSEYPIPKEKGGTIGGDEFKDWRTIGGQLEDRWLDNVEGERVEGLVIVVERISTLQTSLPTNQRKQGLMDNAPPQIPISGQWRIGYPRSSRRPKANQQATQAIRLVGIKG